MSRVTPPVRLSFRACRRPSDTTPTSALRRVGSRVPTALTTGGQIRNASIPVKLASIAAMRRTAGAMTAVAGVTHGRRGVRGVVPLGQHSGGVRGDVLPGQDSRGLRGVVPPGRHRGGVRGVVLPGQHSGGVREDDPPVQHSADRTTGVVITRRAVVTTGVATVMTVSSARPPGVAGGLAASVTWGAGVTTGVTTVTTVSSARPAAAGGPARRTTGTPGDARASSTTTMTLIRGGQRDWYPAGGWPLASGLRLARGRGGVRTTLGSA